MCNILCAIVMPCAISLLISYYLHNTNTITTISVIRIHLNANYLSIVLITKNDDEAVVFVC